jgi:hypothetical protein
MSGKTHVRTMIAQSRAEWLAGAATVDKQTVTLKDKINLPRGPRTSDILPTETIGFHASNEPNSPCATVPYPRDLFRDTSDPSLSFFPVHVVRTLSSDSGFPPPRLLRCI